MTMLTTDKRRPAAVCGLDTWVPVAVEIVEIQRENFNTLTFRMRFVEQVHRDGYRFLPGQFNMLYVPGVGEAAISISSDPDETDTIGHTIRVVGSVTRAIERLGVGGLVGLRGPFGRGWPIDAMRGQDVVIVAGGIGLAPMRPAIYSLLRYREQFGRVLLLYGCRSPDDRVFAPELEKWTEDESIQVLVTVDNATGGWVGPVGVVTNLLQRIRVNAQKTVVLVCGPPILNRVAAWQFLQLHVPPDRVYVSLERNMNCGFGRCGHCQYGRKFVCTDGPVFAFSDVADIFGREEI
jgi:NAD(P)H-flavin reductase